MESLFNCIVDFEETQYYIYKYSRRKFLLLFLNKHIYLLIFLKNIVFFFFGSRRIPNLDISKLSIMLIFRLNISCD